MKIEAFRKIILLLKKQQDKSLNMYQLGIDLINYDEPFDEINSILIGSIYGKEGLDIFYWWCYDNEWGTKDLEFIDKDGERLCQTIEDLHQYLEENKVDDYELRHNSNFNTEAFAEMWNNLTKDKNNGI